MEWTIGDIIAIVAVVLSVTGGVFAFLKWRKQTQARYSEVLRDIIYNIRVDEENRDIFYQLEYGKFKYTPDFHSSELEKKTDKLLTQYNYFCYLRSKKVIGKDEFAIVKYHIHRAISNIHIQNYLFNIYHFAKKVQNGADNDFSFAYLIKYGVGAGIIKENFYEKDNKDYIHVLNF